MSDRGKTVLKINWEHEGIKIEVPVKAYTDRDNGITFRARYDEVGISEESSDINVIKQAVEKKLREWYTIDWTLYMMVEVSGESVSHHGPSMEVKFETEFYVIGKDVRGTERYMRVPEPRELPASPEHVNVTRWSGVTPQDGRPEVGKQLKDSWGHRNGNTLALVLATRENVQAAKNFIKAMERLLLNMHDHFAPDKVELTLARACQLLLPAPKKLEKKPTE